MRRKIFVFAALATIVLSCTQGERKSPQQETDTSASTTASAPSSQLPTTVSNAEPTKDANTLEGPESIGLVKGKEADYIDYAFSGTGDSSSMNVRVTNKTDREWSVDVEVGTKLEPAEGSVQQMVVTKEVHVKVHPHYSQTAEVEVACLDISKDTPAANNDTWKATVSSQLAAFIECVRREDEQSVQAALWYRRGATRQEWVDYFIKYQNMTQADAQQAADSVDTDIGALARRCGS